MQATSNMKIDLVLTVLHLEEIRPEHGNQVQVYLLGRPTLDFNVLLSCFKFTPLLVAIVRSCQTPSRELRGREVGLCKEGGILNSSARAHVKSSNRALVNFLE